jgi:T4 RnlA family RNA ligase
MHKLPTKEQCDLIISSNEAFYKKEVQVDDYNIVVYNYRLASISDFVNPLKLTIFRDGWGHIVGERQENDELKAFELRGITFVQQRDGFWKRFIALSKFFNYGETTGWLPEDVDTKSIKSVHEKLDGSMIHFILLPNGKWKAKTKQSFISTQAEAANRILDQNPELELFLNTCYANNEVPIFEYTAPDNQIVLKYSEEQLQLIQLRDAISGAYLNLNDKSIFDASDYSEVFHNYVTTVSYPAGGSNTDVTALRVCQKAIVGSEGWVVNFDGQLVKFKTNWYFLQHKAKEQLVRSDATLLELVLTEAFDDAISLLDDGFKDLKEELNYKAQLIRKWFNHELKEIEEAVFVWNDSRNKVWNNGFKDFKKCFAIQYKSSRWFHAIILAAEKGLDPQKALSEVILKQYNKQELASDLIQNLIKEDLKKEVVTHD